MAVICTSTLKTQRSQDCFEKLWQEVNQKAQELGVDEPKLGRKRRGHPRFVETETNTYHEHTVDELYRKNYFEIVDKLIAEIERRSQSLTFILYTAWP